ncbi:unnamed protein product [Rotaria magnacalcarata]|uniref:Uncharacterized protein n=1 Tax=Rotaria magnacalcarata TaxID=392030 RepID=A0A8S2VX79_9BILA|nr:unnamed protein product [Rotaria magnacalcarata]
MSEFALQKNTPLGFADLGLLATVELQIIHVYDKSRVVVLSADSGTIRDTRTVSLDTQRSLISARRCKDLDGYSQQVD